MNEELPSLLIPDTIPDSASNERPVRPTFRDPNEAAARLSALEGPANAAECLSRFLGAIAEMSPPDELLVDFQRYVQRSDDRAELYQFLIDNPRAIEMLVKLFAGSRYLTETLLRDPAALRKLIQNRWLADLKTRDEFIAAALAVAEPEATFDAKLDAVRRYQRSELLRIGVCDAFGLVDFRAATVQLSLLADGMIETCLQLVAADLGVNPAGFAVIAMGKLGGEELNYSSDIDLVFLTQNTELHAKASTAILPNGPDHAVPRPPMNDGETVTLAQRLIKSLQDATGEGFLYRVDMRLRPWGRAGELVVRVPAYVDYLRKQAELWEKQALVKARVVAGEHAVGRRLLIEAAPIIFGHPAEIVRASVRSAKSKIEAQLERRGRSFGEVKSGSGSIRDIEFVIQSLQLIHGQRLPQIRSANTLTALVRLADFDLIHADEYRCLSEGYVFLRTIEHSLQLLHNRQEHSLPTDPTEITSLAHRLDFHDGEHLISHYRQHCLAIRAVYDKYVTKAYDSAADNALPASHDHEPGNSLTTTARGTSASVKPIASYETVFSEDERREHLQRLATLNDAQPVRVDATSQPGGAWRVQVIGIDQPGELSLICGLLFVYGFDIVEGFASTGQNFGKGSKNKITFRDFVDVFTVRSSIETVMDEVWHRYESDLTDLVQLARSGRGDEAQGRLASRVAEALEDSPDLATKPSPLEVSFDNQSHDRFTVLRIHGEDTIGFLYELTNALALCGIAIEQVLISSEGDRAADILYVTDAQRQCKILDEARRQELQAAVVLIKHFTHLLPGSPNPEAALLHFRAFVSQLFHQPDWTEQLSSLDRPEVLSALAQLLGVSDFLWEDFLRLQYANLFPVLSDIQGIETAKSKTLLWRDLAIKLSATDDPGERRRDLNDFKDREMFRIDLRHILGRCGDFDQFAEELTDVAEVIVATSLQLNESEFHDRYGVPKRSDGDRASLVVCALGKCGGRELGFASDIELLFVYDEEGMTDGRDSIANASFFQRLVEGCVHSIRARQEGIFRIDTRLRPYGRSGPLAVSFDAFKRYFDPNGAAWPYERQALIKLRPIAGDPGLGEKLIALRDQFLYEGPPFDFASMRAMRERQIRQLVSAGEFNAKLSPGGLVDIEYLVQALQITHGSRHESLRVTNTCIAMDEMRRVGVLSELDHRALRDAYGFFRKLIDALRMVRGDARDLTVSANIGDDFQFLARRLGYGSATQKLKRDIALHSETVNDMVRRLSANGA